MKKLIFATGNEDKMREIREILADSGYEILSMKEAGVDLDIVEDGTTFEENAMIKYCRVVPYYDNKQRGLMPIAHLVLNEEIELNEEEKVSLINEIVYRQIIANPNMSSRQIPSKFRIRESMPLSKNGKINFNELINEGLKGTEINVDVEETNLSVGNIQIYSLLKEKDKILGFKKK